MQSLNEQLEQAQKEFGTGNKTNYYKFQEGNNRIRILTEGKVFGQHFVGNKFSTCYGKDKGCPFHYSDEDSKMSTKFVCYILDLNDKEQKIQLADLPYSVIKQVGSYQENPDYAFDSFPMPYDITVKYDSKAAPANKYQVMPSPKREEVSEEIKLKLSESMSNVTPESYIERKKSRSIEDHQEKGVWLFPEKLASMEEERVKNYKKDLANHNAKMKGKTFDLEYPVEEINPNDIPF